MRSSAFQIHGVSLLVQSENLPSIVALEDRLSPYRVKSVSDPTLRVFIQNATERTRRDVSKIPHRLRWVRSRPLWGHAENGILSITDGVSVSTVDYNRKEADIQIAPATMTDAHFLSRTFLLLTVIELLRTEKFYYLHGALVARDSRTFLILGEGGDGKSTLSASLLENHWELSSDDNLLLHLNAQGRCEVFPLEQELSVSPEVREQLSVTGQFPMERQKVRIPLEKFRPSPLSGQIPTEIGILSLSTPPVEAPSPSYVFKLILRENPLLWAEPGFAAPHARAIQQLIQQSRLIWLHFPREEAVDLQKIGRQFIDQAIR